ncbi:aromatic acid decarboxylase [Methanosarcinales archaeon]|nr:MAG: aromatic acid decarboxylase [Methanosarcinales archaeon]
MRIVVGMTGASGIQIGLKILDVLSEGGDDIDIDLILSKPALRILQLETDMFPEDVVEKATFVWDDYDMDAPVASGSCRFDGMVVVPCSMKTLGEIASGISQTLISRVADVCLKERRKLVLVPRETPLNVIHLENMLKVARAGAIVLPACPAYYTRPRTAEDCIDFIAGRVLDMLGVKHSLYTSWEELREDELREG